MRKFIALILLVSVLTIGLALTGAAQNKTLTLYTSVPTEIITKVAKAFEAENPDIKVDVFRSGTGTITAKIAAEEEAGDVKADVVWVADFAYYETLKERDLLMKYRSPAAGSIPDSLKDPEGYYYGARMITMIIAYNTNFVDEPPTTWKGLLDDKWEGLIGMANPLYSGAALDTVGSITMNYGLEFYRELRANGASVVRGNSGTARSISSGEFPVGITLDYIVRNQKAEGSPIETVYPDDGAVAIPSPIGIISNTDAPEAAKTFLDFAVAREGQETLRELGSFIPVIPGMTPPAGAPSLEELTDSSLPIDWGFIRRNTEWLRDEFTKIMLE